MAFGMFGSKTPPPTDPADSDNGQAPALPPVPPPATPVTPPPPPTTLTDVTAPAVTPGDATPMDADDDESLALPKDDSSKAEEPLPSLDPSSFIFSSESMKPEETASTPVEPLAPTDEPATMIQLNVEPEEKTAPKAEMKEEEEENEEPLEEPAAKEPVKKEEKPEEKPKEIEKPEPHMSLSAPLASFAPSDDEKDTILPPIHEEPKQEGGEFSDTARQEVEEVLKRDIDKEEEEITRLEEELAEADQAHKRAQADMEERRKSLQEYEDKIAEQQKKVSDMKEEVRARRSRLSKILQDL